MFTIRRRAESRPGSGLLSAMFVGGSFLPCPGSGRSPRASEANGEGASGGSRVRVRGLCPDSLAAESGGAA